MLPVIAEPNRQKILQLIWNREQPAGAIAGHFDVTFGAISQHLRVLREHGLVDLRKQGRVHYYKANRQALGPLAAYLESMWQPRLTALKNLAEEAELTQKAGI